MSNIRNSTFVGSPVADVDVDQLTFKRALHDAIGDTQLAEDVLTGDNSPPASSTVDHRGLDGSLYRGSLIGAPLVQCIWPANGGITYGPSLAHTSGDDVYIIVQPFYLPKGETQIDIIVYTPYTQSLVAEVRTLTGGTLIDSVELRLVEPGVRRMFISDLTPATRYYLAVRASLAATGVLAVPVPEMEIRGFFLGFLRQTSAPLMTVPKLTSSPFSLTTTTASGATIMSQPTFDTALSADNQALSSYHCSRLNRKQNGLDEYLTGAPCAGNAAYTLVDSGSTNPTQSAFHDHSQSGKANEPLIDFPVWGQPWGGCQTDGTLAGFQGTWEPPALTVDSAPKELTRMLVYMPDMPEFSGGDTKLEVCVIVCSPADIDISAVDVVVEFFNSAGIVTNGSASTALVQIGSTRFWRAIVTDVPFIPDALDLMTISFDASMLLNDDGSYLRALGGCAHFKV
jgi:hypothetical protein